MRVSGNGLAVSPMMTPIDRRPLGQSVGTGNTQTVARRQTPSPLSLAVATGSAAVAQSKYKPLDVRNGIKQAAVDAVIGGVGGAIGGATVGALAGGVGAAPGAFTGYVAGYLGGATTGFMSGSNAYHNIKVWVGISG